MQSKLPSDKKLIRYFFDSDGRYSEIDCKTNDKTESHDIMPLPVQSRDILSKLLADRIYLIKDEVSEISQQIDDRQRLKQSLDTEIDLRVCEVQTVIYHLELDMGEKIDKSRRRISLEQQIGELYKEKRQGELSNWQDTVMLKRELRKAEKELRSATLDLWMLKFLS